VLLVHREDDRDVELAAEPADQSPGQGQLGREADRHRRAGSLGRQLLVEARQCVDSGMLREHLLGEPAEPQLLALVRQVDFGGGGTRPARRQRRLQGFGGARAHDSPHIVLADPPGLGYERACRVPLHVETQQAGDPGNDGH
jgi:hypothetical protein